MDIIFPTATAATDLLVRVTTGVARACSWKTRDPNHVGDWPQTPIVTEIGPYGEIHLPDTYGITTAVKPTKAVREWARKHLKEGERCYFIVRVGPEKSSVLLQPTRYRRTPWVLGIVESETVLRTFA